MKEREREIASDVSFGCVGALACFTYSMHAFVPERRKILRRK